MAETRPRAQPSSLNTFARFRHGTEAACDTDKAYRLQDLTKNLPCMQRSALAEADEKSIFVTVGMHNCSGSRQFAMSAMTRTSTACPSIPRTRKWMPVQNWCEGDRHWNPNGSTRYMLPGFHTCCCCCKCEPSESAVNCAATNVVVACTCCHGSAFLDGSTCLVPGQVADWALADRASSCESCMVKSLGLRTGLAPWFVWTETSDAGRDYGFCRVSRQLREGLAAHSLSTLCMVTTGSANICRIGSLHASVRHTISPQSAGCNFRCRSPGRQ